MRLIYILCILLVTIDLSAQFDEIISKKEKRELIRLERQARREKELEVLRAQTELLIQNQRFVLEADYISDGRGNRFMVSSQLNFIVIDSASAVIQLGSITGIGYNGVGGVTVDGNVSKYEIKNIEKKGRKRYSVRISFNSSYGNYDIFLSVGEDGSAEANVRGIWSGQVLYSGDLVPITESKVYKGSSL